MAPLRVWTDGGTGNYWDGGHGYLTETVLASGYSPTDPTEGRLHRTNGAVTLAASPAATALAEIRTTSPGLRKGHVADTAPLADPVSPDVIAELRAVPPDTAARAPGGETDDG